MPKRFREKCCSNKECSDRGIAPMETEDETPVLGLPGSRAAKEVKGKGHDEKKEPSHDAWLKLHTEHQIDGALHGKHI